ncbi:Cobalt-precorrin-8 methylmutase [hydrothermal vent metagenome]|uniref:Cobalt-precorrin-8 methylmutase n=1 Tax=hydrothermal vent metagenome TaxID=652676 RepID=A0A3B0QS12_9ZZZZ
MKNRKGFLIIAHGSRREEANERVYELTAQLKNYFQTDLFEPAFMELAKPSIRDGINALAARDIDEIVAFPFFLFKGMHYSKDVPNIIERAVAKLDKDIKITMMDPVGMHPQVFDLVQEMLYDQVTDQFEFKKIEPSKIEDKSMEIIERAIEDAEMPEDERPVVKRVIHTTGDFDFLKSMIFQGNAVAEGCKALLAKKTIFTDVTMVQAGVNKRFGHEVRCVLNDPGVEEGAAKAGMTKAAYALRSLGTKLNGNIVAIGNAPTALIKLVDMIKQEGIRPALVIGIPVGFVNAKESKEYLRGIDEVPYITNRGQKGGSTVAAAIVNALIKAQFMAA